MQLVVFTIAASAYGLPINQVREINRLTRITTVPKVPEHIMGVISLRGEVIPVISLRKLFGYPASEGDAAARIIIAEGGEVTAGLLVDSVTEVERFQEETLEPVPDRVGGGDDLFRGITRVGDRLVLVLNVERLINMENVYGKDNGRGAA